MLDKALSQNESVLGALPSQLKLQLKNNRSASLFCYSLPPSQCGPCEGKDPASPLTHGGRSSGGCEEG